MGRKKMTSRRAVLDSLEKRELLAQINVTSFGAVANDGKDDLAAIKAAVNASANGDTIYFSSGTFNLSDQVFLKGSRTYKGDGTTLKGDPAKHIFHIQQDNTRVEGFTFDGKPIMIDTPNNLMVAGAVITNNTFKNSATGSNANGITFTTGMRNSTISYNTFTGGGMALYGYYWDGLTVANNDFLNCVQGIHVDDHSNNSKNLLIEQNVFSGIRRMGVEYQGGGTNTIVQDNWYEKPVMTSVRAENGSTFAFSIVADRSVGTIARRNVIYAPERPDGVGVRIGFETGGDGTLVENNYVYGINQVLANTDGAGTTSCLARNNYYSNVLDGLVGRGLTQTNNGPQVNLQWLYNRGKAGRSRHFADPANSGGAVQTVSTSSTTTTTPSTPTSSSTPVAATLPSGTSYFSDLGYTVVANGYGAAEKNKSNGESGANDGHTITLNGTTYAKGIGVHANSTITYNLAGKYSQFLSDIGVDDEVGTKGGVIFQVWLDGVKAYDSAKMTGATATKAIAINTVGKTTLKLVVTDGGDGADFDHADWANAKLVAGTSTTLATTPSTTPTTTPATSTTGTWLSDLATTSAVNGWGAFEKDRSNGESGAADGKTITLRGTKYTKGIGVHANSDLKFNLAGKYTTFTSDIGIDDETGGLGSVIFRVYLDGKLAYDSGTVHGKDAIKKISLSVAGVKELRLVVDSAGDGNVKDHGDWASAKLV